MPTKRERFKQLLSGRDSFNKRVASWLESKANNVVSSDPVILVGPVGKKSSKKRLTKKSS